MFVFDLVGWIVGWNLLFGTGIAVGGYKVGRAVGPKQKALK